VVNTVVAIPQIVTLDFGPNGNLRKFKVQGANFKAQEANFKVDRGKVGRLSRC
jgi:hypothetical protein